MAAIEKETQKWGEIFPILYRRRSKDKGLLCVCVFRAENCPGETFFRSSVSMYDLCFCILYSHPSTSNVCYVHDWCTPVQVTSMYMYIQIGILIDIESSVAKNIETRRVMQADNKEQQVDRNGIDCIIIIIIRGMYAWCTCMMVESGSPRGKPKSRSYFKPKSTESFSLARM